MRATTSIAIGGTAQVAVSFGFARYAYGMYAPEIGRTFELSLAGLGVISGSSYTGYMIGVVAAGFVAARGGARTAILVGGVAGVVGLLTAALAPTPPVLAAGVVLAGSSAGWVWAPYSDLVGATDDGEQARGRALASISTGTAFGLMVLAACLLGAAGVSWRVVWGGFAVAVLAVAVLNVRVLPRPTRAAPTAISRPAATSGRAGGLLEFARRPGLVVPVLFAMLSVGSGSVYFTYATTVASSPAVAAGVFLVVGVAGAFALASDRLVAHIGLVGAAVAGLVGTAGGIAVLALGDGRPAVVLASAVVFGGGYMPCSAVLSLWTTQVAPEAPATTLTLAVLCAGLSATAFPPTAGWLASLTSLPDSLLATAALTLLGAAALATQRAPRTPPRVGQASSTACG